MTKTQIYNLHIFSYMFVIDNNIHTTSPDYIKEKSIRFFGQLGKNNIIEFKNKRDKKIYMEYWEIYCESWGTKPDDYQLLNMILFLLYNRKKKNIIKNFEKYVGATDIIANLDLKYMAHPKLLTYIDNTINLNSRYFKLKTL